jgi:hypothetical protein
MIASEWDWTLRVFDHVDLNASDYTVSVRFYETVLSPLGIPKIAGRMVRRGTASTALVTTRLSCSTRMGTTLRRCTATSETSATVKVRRCTDRL